MYLESIKHNSNVLRELKLGDIVEFTNDQCSHWAIYAGDKKVIELVEDEGNNVKGTQNYYLIRGNADVSVAVKEHCFWTPAAGNLANKENSLDEQINALPQNVIISRAKSKLGRVGKPLIFLNCQHFALWCRYGSEKNKLLLSEVKKTHQKEGRKSLFELRSKSLLQKDVSSHIAHNQKTCSFIQQKNETPCSQAVKKKDPTSLRISPKNAPASECLLRKEASSSSTHLQKSASCSSNTQQRQVSKYEQRPYSFQMESSALFPVFKHLDGLMPYTPSPRRIIPLALPAVPKTYPFKHKKRRKANNNQLATRCISNRPFKHKCVGKPIKMYWDNIGKTCKEMVVFFAILLLFYLFYRSIN